MWSRILAANDTFTAMRNGTREHFVKLLLLDFFASSLYLQPSRIAYSWTEGQITLDALDIESVQNDALHYMEQLSRHETVLREMHNLSDAIDLISDTLLTDLEKTSDVLNPLARDRVAFLQRTCRQRLACTTRSLDTLNRRFEAQNKLRNIEESKSVKRLSILATIFLPLSLSASILSIQERFSNLGPKLYDFAGVFVIVGSMALLLLLLVKVSFRLQSRLSSFSPRELWAEGSRLRSLYFAFSYSAAWAIILASFVTGMFKSVVLGWKILGFGLAGLLAPPVSLLPCLMFFFFLNSYFKRRRFEAELANRRLEPAQYWPHPSPNTALSEGRY